MGRLTKTPYTVLKDFLDNNLTNYNVSEKSGKKRKLNRNYTLLIREEPEQRSGLNLGTTKGMLKCNLMLLLYVPSYSKLKSAKNEINTLFGDDSKCLLPSEGMDNGEQIIHRIQAGKGINMNLQENEKLSYGWQWNVIIHGFED